MSFLSGIGNFVQNVGPTAGAVAQAQAQGTQMRTQQAIQLLMLARQQRQMEIDNALKQAQTGEATAKAQTYSPEYAGQKAGAEAAATQWYKVQQMEMDLQNHLQELQAAGANAMDIAAARIQGEQAIAAANIQAAAARQSNQQTFQAGQNAQNRQNQQGITGQNIQGRLQGIRQTQSGEIFPELESIIGRGPLSQPLPTSPASRPTAGAAPLTQQTSGAGPLQPSEYQTLKGMGYSDSDIQSGLGGGQ